MRDWRLYSIAAVLTVLAGCSRVADSPKATQKAAAKVENRVAEADLTKVTLTPEAEGRLGIELAEVAETQVTGISEIAGEAMVIPGRALIATAPVSGSLRFARPSLAVGQTVRKGEVVFRLTPLLGPQRDLRTTYEADLQTAKARLDNATLQLQRARQLLRDLAGSQRQVDASEQEFAQAKAAHDAAAQRLQRLDTHPLDADVDMEIQAPETGVVRQILSSAGQTVASGAPLIEVADISRLWLRVPVYAGDADSLAAIGSVSVRDLDGRGEIRQATRVAAPPTADPLASTADLYFELPNLKGQIRPGQRMRVILPSHSSQRGIVVPRSAVLYDIHGGAWVYVNDAPHQYRRRRVEPLQTDGARAILARGPAVGAKVVTSGAAELFGTEFGAGK